MKDTSKNVTTKDLATTAFVLVFLFGGFFVAEIYSNPIGLSIAAIPIFIALYQIVQMPRESQKAIAEQLKKQEKTIFGRLIKSFEYIAVLIIIFAIFQALFKSI